MFQVSSGIVKQVFSSNMHYKCRNDVYPGSKISRFFVPDDKVQWSVHYDEYQPPTYTANAVFGKPWSDPEIGSDGFNPSWNTNDGKIDRTCGSHKYEIDCEGFPINPVGRTGLKGRGLLGRWGPNCAADCIVTRWKRNFSNNEIICNSETNKGVIEFVAIKRRDCGEWAIPGGFADQNEHFMETVKREFFEEALSHTPSVLHKDNVEIKEQFEGGEEVMRKLIDNAFANGKLVYSGYVDDRRNTDQAWITTNAVNVHDNGVLFNSVVFKAGDDAVDVKWMEVDRNLELYANHKTFVMATAELLGAYV